MSDWFSYTPQDFQPPPSVKYWVGIVPNYRNPAAYTLHVLDQDEYEGFRQDHPRIPMYDSLPVSHSILDIYARLNNDIKDVDDDDDEYRYRPSLIICDGIRRRLKELEQIIVPFVKLANEAYARRKALLVAYRRACGGV
jgi:hypothetical protein